MTVVERMRRPSARSSACPEGSADFVFFLNWIVLGGFSRKFFTPQYTAVAESMLSGGGASLSAMLMAATNSAATMLPHVSLLRHPQGIAAVVTGTAAVAGVAAYLLLRKRLTPEEKEEKRRTRLAAVGRVIDGELVDATAQDKGPQALIYRYRVSGVTYECGQNISTLISLLPELGDAADIFGVPVQVRYDRDNPADSIVISETWNGLWNRNGSNPEHPAQP
jgi:hypothetical protein